jgi:hypothetical protein
MGNYSSSTGITFSCEHFRAVKFVERRGQSAVTSLACCKRRPGRTDIGADIARCSLHAGQWVASNNLDRRMHSRVLRSNFRSAAAETVSRIETAQSPRLEPDSEIGRKPPTRVAHSPGTLPPTLPRPKRHVSCCFSKSSEIEKSITRTPIAANQTSPFAFTPPRKSCSATPKS